MFNLPIKYRPSSLTHEETLVRMRLIYEELSELDQALMKGDIIEVAKELADLLYVTYGTASVCGIDIEPIFKEVHRSNMSKIGRQIKDNKPDSYSPVAIGPIIKSQL